MFFPKSVITKSEILHINPVQEVFLKKFNLLDRSKQIQLVQEFFNNCYFDLIVKLACNNQAFRDVCLLPSFSNSWLTLWSTFGIVITRDRKKALYDQPNTEKFDLFLGIYFYNKALQTAKSMNKEFSALELSYLIEAMNYGSIHAYQKYHQYLYSLTQPESTDSEQEKLAHFKQIIANIKKLIPTYRVYAYLLLIEAYVRYGLLMSNAGNMIVAEQAQQSALKACSIAESLYIKGGENTLMYNASLGGTLRVGNYSLNSINFTEIQAIIIKSFESLEPEIAPVKNSLSLA
jgi:hypothetical protein